MVLETARLLQESGHTPVLLHFGSKCISSCANKLNIEHHVIPHHRLYKKFILLPFFIAKSLCFFKTLELDTLHSHLFSPVFTFAIIARAIKLPHIGTLHDTYMIEDNPKRIWLIKSALFLKTKLIAVSLPMQIFYAKAGNFKQSDITYIPNFSAENIHLKDRTECRNELNLLETDIAIFSVGRLVKLKRFDRLIEAISKLDNHNNVKSFIIGSGPEAEDLQLLINHHNLQNSIFLLGERHDVQRLLASADIFTLTSETEGMSKSILEALAAGLPVIATDVGGNKDLVLDSINGFLLQDDAPEVMATKIESLLTNKALRQSMSKSSKNLLETKYSAIKFIENHLDIYRSSLKEY